MELGKRIRNELASQRARQARSEPHVRIVESYLSSLVAEERALESHEEMPQAPRAVNFRGRLPEVGLGEVPRGVNSEAA